MNYNGKKLNLTKFVLLSLAIFAFEICNSVDVSINTTSSYVFSEKIIKTSVTTFNGQQILLILFSNGTISKLDSQLQFIQIIQTLDKKMIVDFQICNNVNFSNNTPTILSLINGGSQMIIIGIQNTSAQISQSVLSGTMKYFCTGITIQNGTLHSFDGGYYSQDLLQQYTSVSNQSTINFQNNFTISTGSSNRQYVKKVIESKYQSNNYLFSQTSGYKLNIFKPSASLLKQDKSFSSVLSSNSIVQFHVDKQSIILIQLSNNIIYAKDLISNVSITFGPSYAPGLNVTTLSLKAVRPKYDTDGYRMFIFHNYIYKFHLSSNSYDSFTLYQTGLPFAKTSQLGFVAFSSGKNGFVYSKNDTKIYSYCESLTNLTCTSNTLPCSVSLPYCNTCDSSLTYCQNCSTNYFLLNNSCYFQTPCADQNCKTCIKNNLFVQCQSWSVLDSINYTCSSNQTTENATIQSNQTSNSTQTNSATSTNQTTSMNNTNANSPTNSSQNGSTNATNTTQSALSNSTTGNSGQNNINSQNNNSAATNQTTNNNGIQNYNNFSQNSTIKNSTNTTTGSQNGSESKNNSPAINNQQFTKSSILAIQNEYSQSMQTIAQTSTLLNSSPLYRLFLGFLGPLFGLFDDYWFYIYHQNTFNELQILPSILVFMYIVNSQRVLPDYLSISADVTIKPFADSSKSYQNYTNERILLIDENVTYLEQNLEPLILQQYIFQIIAFVLIASLVRLLKKLLKKYKNQNTKPQTKNVEDFKKQKQSDKSNEIERLQIYQKQKISRKNARFKKLETLNNQKNMPLQEIENYKKRNAILQSIVEYLESTISFRSIILTSIGANIIFLSFQISLQLNVFISFRFLDIINLVFTSFGGMVFIIAFCVLLTLSQNLVPTVKIRKRDNNKQRKQKLEEKKDIQNEDFYQLMFESVKCILYGFIHGYFINHNEVQYILLILVKIFLISVILRRKQYFKHRIFSVLKLLYFVMGIGVDVLCLLSKLEKLPKNMTKDMLGTLCALSIIELSILVPLLITVLLYVVIEALFGLREAFCRTENGRNKFRNNAHLYSIINKIVPINQENDKQNQDNRYEIKSGKFTRRNEFKSTFKQRINLKELYNDKFTKKNQSLKNKNILIDITQESEHDEKVGNHKNEHNLTLFKQKSILSKRVQNGRLKYRFNKYKKTNFVVENIIQSINQSTGISFEQNKNEFCDNTVPNKVKQVTKNQNKDKYKYNSRELREFQQPSEPLFKRLRSFKQTRRVQVPVFNS